MNRGHIDWTTTTISSGANERKAHNELLNLFDEHSLTNTQYQSTREDKNLDLQLTTRPSLIKNCENQLTFDKVVTDYVMFGFLWTTV